MHRPSWKNAGWVGLLLGLSALVNFVHTAYFVFFFTAYWLFYYFVIHRHRFLSARFLKKAGLALLIAAALTLPFFIPVIKKQLTTGPAHFTEPGLIMFSVSPLSFVLPSPLHPLVQYIGAKNTLADLLGVSYAETMAYIGVIPLILSVWAASQRRRQAGFWLGFAVLTAVLALGPVLKWGKEPIKINVEDTDIFTPLPYLFLHLLPIFDLGRTPARIAGGTAMALAVLASLGMIQLLAWLEKRGKSWMTRPIVPLVSVLILIEYCVAFPYPTAPLDTPEFYHQVRQEEGEFAILDYPLNIQSGIHEFKRPMYYQTTHERPIVGGKVWRFLPDGGRALLWVDSLLPTRELLHPAAFPIERSPAEQRGWLSALGFRYLVLHKYDPADMLPNLRDPQRLEKEKAYFTDLLSSPIYQDDDIIVFSIPDSEMVKGLPLVALGRGWHERSGERMWRWTEQEAQIDTYTWNEATYRLAFNAQAFYQPRQLLFSVNGEPVYTTTVNHERRFITPAFHLNAGENEITLTSQEPCARPIDVEPENPDARCLSFRVSQMEWVSATQTYGDDEAQAQFGDYFKLLGYDLASSQARLGGHVELVLYWEIIKPPDRDYTVFNHLYNAQGVWAGQQDSPPLKGIYPTTWFGVGEIVRDEYQIPISEDASPGTYDLFLGWYHLPTGARLPLLQKSVDGHQDSLFLTQVEVVE